MTAIQPPRPTVKPSTSSTESEVAGASPVPANGSTGETMLPVFSPRAAGSAMEPASIAQVGFFGRILGGAMTLLGALLFTAGLFLVLPILQMITADRPEQEETVKLAAATEPPPPPPPEEEPPKEEKEEKPPELNEPKQQQQLDLAAMDLALNAGIGGSGYLKGNFEINVNAMGDAGDGDGLGLGGITQKPKRIYQATPRLNANQAALCRGKTFLVMALVDDRGKITDVRIKACPVPSLEKAFLDAARKSKVAPAKVNGKPLKQSRVILPWSYPK